MIVVATIELEKVKAEGDLGCEGCVLVDNMCSRYEYIDENGDYDNCDGYFYKLKE